MGAFTRLGDAELGELAAAFALGAVRGFTPIAAGTINSSFDVETERGRWVVRVNEGKAEDALAWEARLVEALAAGRLPVAPPVRAAGGAPYAPLAGAAGKWVSVFPWRSGRHLAPEEVTPEHVAALGEALASMHLIGAALPPSWRRPSIYDHDHLVARHRGFAGSRDPELARAIEVLGEELAFVEAAAPIRGAATAGIIHGDLFRDNVLWDGPRLAALLDFEQASGGSLAYDLAVCVNEWCWDGGLREDLARSLFAGYQRRRALPAADRAALPVEVRAAAARFTITRITDVYLARLPRPEKDFRAFLTRCEAWRGPALGQVTALL